MKYIYRLLLLPLLLLVSCGGAEEEPIVTIKSLTIKPRSVTLVVGGTIQFSVTSDPLCEELELLWRSDNDGVATVDGNGVVTAVGAGKATVICSYGDSVTARASVNVIENNKVEEEARTLESLLSERLIFSSRQLTYPGTVMQCFDFYDSSKDGYIYFSQCGGDTATGSKWIVVLSRVKRGAYGDKTVSSDRMSLRWFGHGTNLCVEKATDGGEDFMWLNTNGTVSSTSTSKVYDYSNNKTFCRLRYQPNATFEHYAGENFYLSSYTDTSGKKWNVSNLQVSLDFEYRRMLITCTSSGTRHCVIYDLDKVLALKEQTVTLERIWGGEAGTNTERKKGTTTLPARVLDNLTPLGSFRIASNLNSGNYNKTYSCSFQGQAIYGNRVFWYEGQPLESVVGSGVYDNAQAYVEVFDYRGNRLVPRQRVAAVSDFDGMKRLLNLNENLFSEAEGMQIKDGGKKLYLGVTTHLAGATTKNRLSTILEYDYSE